MHPYMESSGIVVPNGHLLVCQLPVPVLWVVGFCNTNVVGYSLGLQTIQMGLWQPDPFKCGASFKQFLQPIYMILV